MNKTYCNICLLGELSIMFKYKTGLRQRDELSLVLFNLALEKMMRNITDHKEMEIVETYTLVA